MKQPVLSNKGKVSCLRKQQGPLMGLETHDLHIMSQMCNPLPHAVSADRGWLVCWWNVVSQTPPTVFKSSKWNLLHMINMTCRCSWHKCFEAQPKGSGVRPFFPWNILVSLFPVTKREVGDILITISNRSSLNLFRVCLNLKLFLIKIYFCCITV